MINVADDNEFSVIVADFIETLAKIGKFKLLIWLNGSELAFEFDNSCRFYFMQEGFRVIKENVVDYIFYDNIASMRVVYEC